MAGVNMTNQKRKTLLYKTGVEYGDYTINPYIGCSHGCTYPCYAYMMAHRFGKAKSITEWEDFKICENAEALLRNELKRMHSKIKSVQLCFSTDPFMYGHDDISNISIKLIKIINEYNIPCYILTKGILPKELIQLNKINFYGITYVSNNEDFRKKYECHAAPLKERLLALKYLSDNGCNTWVSMEPYPTPNIIQQDLQSILEDVYFVDKIVFGRLHYNKLVSSFTGYQDFYNECGETVINYCSKNKINYHIKKGTIINGMSSNEVK